MGTVGMFNTCGLVVPLPDRRCRKTYIKVGVPGETPTCIFLDPRRDVSAALYLFTTELSKSYQMYILYIDPAQLFQTLFQVGTSCMASIGYVRVLHHVAIAKRRC